MSLADSQSASRHKPQGMWARDWELFLTALAWLMDSFSLLSVQFCRLLLNDHRFVLQVSGRDLPVKEREKK